MGETQFLLFIGTFEKCLEMGENVLSYFKTLFVVSPVSRHIFSYLRPKVSRNGNDGKSVTHAGPEQPFKCLDGDLQQMS